MPTLEQLSKTVRADKCIMLSQDPIGSNPQGDRKDKEKIDMALLIKGKDAVKIPDGLHQGTITSVEKDVRGSPKQYEYIDIKIDLADARDGQDNPIQLRDSAPANLTPNTKLGRTIMRFGVTEEQITSGAEIDLEQILVGKQVTLQTLEETTDRGTFAKVVAGSLKPAEAAGEKPVVNSSLRDDMLEWGRT